jgi:regulator of replication initiation timing
MTDKELRKLKRADLIELLYYLSKENDELRADNDKLRSVLYGIVIESRNTDSGDDSGGTTQKENSAGTGNQYE